jgi:hypothetical protein
MASYRLINVADPIDNTDVATKSYVETRINSVIGGGGGVGATDPEARAAIGWPYTNSDSIDARVTNHHDGIINLWSAVGSPYTNP